MSASESDEKVTFADKLPVIIRNFEFAAADRRCKDQFMRDDVWRDHIHATYKTSIPKGYEFTHQEMNKALRKHYGTNNLDSQRNTIGVFRDRFKPNGGTNVWCYKAVSKKTSGEQWFERGDGQRNWQAEISLPRCTTMVEEEQPTKRRRGNPPSDDDTNTCNGNEQDDQKPSADSTFDNDADNAAAETLANDPSSDYDSDSDWVADDGEESEDELDDVFEEYNSCHRE